MPSVSRLALRIFFCMTLAALMMLASAACASNLGRALYSAGEERSVKNLEFVMNHLDDRNAHIRRIAAHALGKLGSQKAVPLLIMLAHDPDQPVMVRRTAVRSLGRLGGPAAGNIVHCLCGDQNPMLRKTASNALKQYAAGADR